MRCVVKQTWFSLTISGAVTSVFLWGHGAFHGSQAPGGWSSGSTRDTTNSSDRNNRPNTERDVFLITQSSHRNSKCLCSSWIKHSLIPVYSVVTVEFVCARYNTTQTASKWFIRDTWAKVKGHQSYWDWFLKIFKSDERKEKWCLLDDVCFFKVLWEIFLDTAQKDGPITWGYCCC